MSRIIDCMERRLLPDAAIRRGIRFLLKARLSAEDHGDIEADRAAEHDFIEMLCRSPIAVSTAEANLQHYELPPDFFRLVLGARLKYSCCLFAGGVDSLDAAEEAMLALTCRRAEIEDGMAILELGCGWGALTLWMAERYPGCSITAVSNSRLQQEHIRSECEKRGIANVQLIKADMNDFLADGRYDRVVSVEMFEHMRNYRTLLARISTWLKSGGKLFVHIFCHSRYAYFFETGGSGNWMGKYFFTGGIMPSDHLLLYFQDDMVLENHWRISGLHYHKTAEAWLGNLDKNKRLLAPVLQAAYGTLEAKRWLQRWRIFFMACAELWGFRGGGEWWVSHYLFRRRDG
jgi:cyclopropane-fatty-acyl-phospholipid synthase